MNQKRALLIINPISGTSKKEGLDRRVTHRLAEKGIAVTTVWTERAGHATELARDGAAQGYDIVIAAGGDGTINETAVGLLETGVTMGIIPCGSGNGLARHLNIPVDIRGALDVIVAGRSEVCDSGSVNGRPFFCTFGMGFDAEVSHKFASSGSRGFITYVRSTVSTLMHYKPQRYEITANGRTITETAFTLAVCNASQYGNNAYIAPKARITDGLLDVTLFHSGNKLRTSLVSLDLMAGSIDKNMLIDTYRVDEVVICRESEGPAHIDGEPLILPAKLHVKCHPASLRILTPAADRRIIPVVTPLKSIAKGMGYSLRNLFSRE